jgi:hypothetical protein
MHFKIAKLVLLPILLSFGSWKNLAPKNHLIDYCQVYGNIFLTKKVSEADFVVFVEDSESAANLVIFEETNSAFANKIGKWNKVQDQAFADHYIYITKNSSEADFTIAYTDVESFSGCQK